MASQAPSGPNRSGKSTIIETPTDPILPPNTGVWAESPASEQAMHVIEVRRDDPKLPADIIAYLKTGGQQTAIDTTGQLTRS